MIGIYDGLMANGAPHDLLICKRVCIFALWMSITQYHGTTLVNSTHSISNTIDYALLYDSSQTNYIHWTRALPDPTGIASSCSCSLANFGVSRFLCILYMHAVEPPSPSPPRVVSIEHDQQPLSTPPSPPPPSPSDRTIERFAYSCASA